ncbi:MAG TPA: prenyltransferase [Anaerolineales bacterium]|nr:prenyltransferase [Anaerolineales bacterium]
MGFLKRFAWAGNLISAALLYALGAGIAQYLGARMRTDVFFLGLIWAAALVLFTYCNYRYFDMRAAADHLGRRLFRALPWRTAMLTGAILAATAAAWATILLLRIGAITQGIWFLMLLGVAGGCLYSIPPARWASNGFGELAASAMMGAGVPALAFMLQYGGYQRYLAMIAFPVSALHLAMLIALNLPGYARQRKYEIRTLVIRMGWEGAMTTHNLLILVAFFLLAVAVLFDFPRFAFYPAILALPLGLLEVYYMQRIAGGIKPNWNALSASAVALFVLPVYFMALAFWTN